MRVTLVYPRLPQELRSYLPHLGLGYIAAILEKYGYNVNIIDMPVLKTSWRDFEREIIRSQLNIVGMSCITQQYPFAVKAAKICKGIDPKITTVLGGPHVTFTAEETLIENPEVDIVVRGEGEYTMLELVQAVENDRKMNHIHGITYRKDGEIIQNPPRPLIKNLDELPFPARHLFPMEAYKKRFDYGSVITSRGCPHRCIFCITPVIFGHNVRNRSPENIVDEIEFELIKRYSYKKFFFIDDTFTVIKKRVILVCNEMLQRGLNVKWGCNTRADRLDLELLEKMREAGCESICMGVESIHPETLKIIKKGLTPKHVERAVRWAQDLGIKVVIAFMLGLPSETKEMAMQTINFVRRINLGPRPEPTPVTPYPGTEMYRNAEKLGIRILHKDWGRYDNPLDPVAETDKMSRNDIIELWFYIASQLIIPSDMYKLKINE